MRLTGARIRIEDLDVRAVITDRTSCRVGFVVPKYKHTAVDRNRLKRRLREAVRVRMLPEWRAAGRPARRADIVIRAVPSTYRISMVELTARIDRATAALRQHLATAATE